jgi:hypothetical protein
MTDPARHLARARRQISDLIHRHRPIPLPHLGQCHDIALLLRIALFRIWRWRIIPLAGVEPFLNVFGKRIVAIRTWILAAVLADAEITAAVAVE